MCYAAIVCFGLCPCQHNGTYTRNVYPATPTKKPAQILRFAESKNEPLSRKILGKAAQKALGKGTGPSNLAKSILVFFVTPLKMGAKKPGSRETSGLFALISFLVQLDGGQYRTRTCDPMHVKHVLIPAELTVHQRDYYSESRWICQALFSRYHAIRRSAASP